LAAQLFEAVFVLPGLLFYFREGFHVIFIVLRKQQIT